MYTDNMAGLGISWGRGRRTRKSLLVATHYTKMGDGLNGLERVKLKKLLKKAAKVAVVAGVAYGGYKLATRPGVAPIAQSAGNFSTGAAEFLKPVAQAAIQKKLNPKQFRDEYSSAADENMPQAQQVETKNWKTIGTNMIAPAVLLGGTALLFTLFRRK